MSRPESNGANSVTPDVAATETRGEVRGRVWLQLPLLLGLVVLWTVLWGQLTWLSVITGFLVALLVTRVFYLPPADLSGRLNVWYSLVFLAHFIVDVTVASFTVALQALNPRPIPPSSMIAVQLHTRSDFIITLNAIATTLVPGSLVVEVDRERAILYFHAFDTQTVDDVEATRQHVLAVESRIVRAIGSKEDLVRIQEMEAAL
ncbi:Na+/H+ antiporter subunit E [Rhodoglobus aureus]|uniref:Na+/H+ antiporter subunit E n=1 Tax=Rhodoglobus aureus TaxID=191497 RepID=A0ABP4GFF6_9MICO